MTRRSRDKQFLFGLLTVAIIFSTGILSSILGKFEIIVLFAFLLMTFLIPQFLYLNSRLKQSRREYDELYEDMRELSKFTHKLSEKNAELKKRNFKLKEIIKKNELEMKRQRQTILMLKAGGLLFGIGTIAKALNKRRESKIEEEE